MPWEGVEEGGEELLSPLLASILVNTSMALIMGGRVDPLAEANVTLIVGPTTVTGYAVITLHLLYSDVTVDFIWPLM